LKVGPQDNFPGDGYPIATKSLDATIKIPLYKGLRLSIEAQNLLNQTSLICVNGDESPPWSGSAPGGTIGSVSRRASDACHFKDQNCEIL